MQLQTLEDVFTEQLADLYSAERQLVQALLKVAGAAEDDELRDAFDEHLVETRNHVARLEEVFQSIPAPIPNEHCKGMEGLIVEGEKFITAEGNGPARDAALIAAAQRVEHYEIAGYGTARALAHEIGYDRAEALLNETLIEEADADKLLTNIATGSMLKSGINDRASEA